MYEGPGIYVHYKGGYYRVLGVAKHESTGKELVIYSSYSIEHDLDRWMAGVDFVARPLTKDDGDDPFNEMVPQRNFPPDFLPRFKKVK
jgi:Protein of unknown function (DUF1653)